jgi:hypothetical protein
MKRTGALRAARRAADFSVTRPRLRPAAGKRVALVVNRAATPEAALAVAPAVPVGPATGTTPRRRLITSGRLSFVLVSLLLIFGWGAQTERYITPSRGVGYALGILGASLMLVLLAYSLRKRWARLEFLGTTPSWFKFHMVLGIAGPLCILYHSNFSTGATNSNVALFSMLAVAGSGVIGRYIYAHIHSGLSGRKLELEELRADAEQARNTAGAVNFAPELLTRLEGAERWLLNAGPRLSLLGFIKPLVVSLAAMRVRGQLHYYIGRSLHAKSEEKHLRERARAYVDRRLDAIRRVAEFEGYERLSSLWQSLHIPLIFVMVVAVIVHVIAVNVY